MKKYLILPLVGLSLILFLSGCSRQNDNITSDSERKNEQGEGINKQGRFPGKNDRIKQGDRDEVNSNDTESEVDADEIENLINELDSLNDSTKNLDENTEL